VELLRLMTEKAISMSPIIKVSAASLFLYFLLNQSTRLSFRTRIGRFGNMSIFLVMMIDWVQRCEHGKNMKAFAAKAIAFLVTRPSLRQQALDTGILETLLDLALREKTGGKEGSLDHLRHNCIKVLRILSITH